MINLANQNADEVLDAIRRKAEADQKTQRATNMMQVYGPIDDLALAHLLVDEFGGMRGIASELRKTYDDATDEKTRVRILSKIMDFIGTVSDKSNMDTLASIPELQEDILRLSKSIAASYIEKGQKALTSQ